jgi:hypothetical protein
LWKKLLGFLTNNLYICFLFIYVQYFFRFFPVTVTVPLPSR